MLKGSQKDSKLKITHITKKSITNIKLEVLQITVASVK